MTPRERLAEAVGEMLEADCPGLAWDAIVKAFRDVGEPCFSTGGEIGCQGFRRLTDEECAIVLARLEGRE